MNFNYFKPMIGGYFLKYTIKDLILALEGKKAYFECQILFTWKKNDIKRKIFLEA